MNQQSFIWGSHGYHREGNKDLNSTHMELQYEEYKSKPPAGNTSAIAERLKKQQLRVRQDTFNRLLERKIDLENERLQYVYRKGVDVAIATHNMTDDWSKIKDLCQAPKVLSTDEKENYLYQTDYGLRKIGKGPGNFETTRRLRPATADPRQRQHSASTQDKAVTFSATPPKKERTKSAPAFRTTKKGIEALVKDEAFRSQIKKIIPPHGPDEYRPMSSTYSGRSSTGLLANPGPCYYQHFLYKKCAIFQRPKSARSAAAMRKDYMDEKARRLSSLIFTNLSQPCTLYGRGGGYGLIQTRQPSSPRPESTKQAWVDMDDKEYYDLHFRDSDEFGMKGSFDRSGMEGDLDKHGLGEGDDMDDGSLEGTGMDDAKYVGDSHRFSQVDYAEVSGADMLPVAAPSEIKEVDFLPMKPSTPFSVTSLEETEEDLHSADADSNKTGEQLDRLTPSPPQLQGTDMLSGEANGAGIVIPFDSTFHPGKDETLLPFEIVMPEPLPIRRHPEPDVHKVDVVSPREDLADMSDNYLDETHFTDAALSESEDTSRKSDDQPVAVSILKSTSQLDTVPSGTELGLEKEKKTSKVSFDLPDSPRSGESDSDSKRSPLKVQSIKHLEGDKDRQKKDETPEKKADQSGEIGDEVPIVVDENAKAADTAEVIRVPSPTPKLDQSQSFHLTTPSPTRTRSPSPVNLDLGPLYQEPDDEFLKRLLAAPDLHGFDIPQYDTPVSTPKKKKKRPGSGKKKKKKKKLPEKVVAPPEEPLFTYVPKFERDRREKERQEAMKEEEGELHRLKDEMRQYDENYRDKMRKQPWLFGRMALSKQICRFWLPLDLRDLQGVSPTRYLIDYCIVCKRRRKLYMTAFDRQLNKRRSLKAVPERLKKALSLNETISALRSVHGDCISEGDVSKVFTYLCIAERLEDEPMYVSIVDQELFINLCALTERVFYNQFVTEDTEDKDSGARDRLETADFDGLKWKLDGMGVTKELRKFLLSL